MEGETQPYTYRVVRTRLHRFTVERVSQFWLPGDPPAKIGQKIKTFWKQDKAEAMAKGLAYGTWTKDGPILAEYTTSVAAVTVEYTTPEDKEFYYDDPQ